MKDYKKISDDEWKKILPKDVFLILRKKHTERPFTGKFLDNKKDGIYVCAGCGNQLFSSETKFDSGSGWPSFYKEIKKENIDLKLDKSLDLERIEVLCGKCNSHLGHLFDDGPEPTKKRFCINSLSLKFIEK